MRVGANGSSLTSRAEDGRGSTVEQDERSVLVAAPARGAATEGAVLDLPVVSALRRAKLSANRDFLKFWTGETVSLFGSQVTALALPLTAVTVLNVNAKQLGLLQFVQFVSFAVLAMPLGVWADRHRRLPVMITTNAIRAVLISLVPVLIFLDALSLDVLYGIVLATGICTALFDVCWMSFVPTLVSDKDLLVEANGKLGMSYSASLLAGPGLGGLLVQLITAPLTLLFDALSYVVSVVSLLWIQTDEPEPAPRERTSTLGQELTEGLRWVLGNSYLRVLATMGALYNFFYMFVQSLFLLFAVKTLSLLPGVVGMILSTGAVGGLLGAGLAGRATRRFPIGRVYQVASVSGFISFLLIPMTTGRSWLAVGTLVAAFFLMTFGLSVANVVSISLRQRITPQPLMARMNAAMRTVMYGLGSLGALTGGFVGATLGLRSALWIGALGATIATVPLFLSSIRRLRTLPSPENER